MNAWMSQLKVGFIGCGNMAQTISKGWLETETLKASQIYATNRSQAKLLKFAEETQIQALESNEKLIEECDIVILSVKPQDLLQAIEDFRHSFDENQIVMSLAAGVSIDDLSKAIHTSVRLVRIMPNTPSSIKEGVIGFATNSTDEKLNVVVDDLFSPLGLVVETEEGESFEALMVSASSGVGFIFELMIYWREWLEEHGYDEETATLMTLKTFLGAAKLAEQSKNLKFEELQSKVTSKKGVTAAGLASMRELELERGLRYSFEKAVLRDRELSK